MLPGKNKNIHLNICMISNCTFICNIHDKMIYIQLGRDATSMITKRQVAVVLSNTPQVHPLTLYWMQQHITHQHHLKYMTSDDAREL